MATHDRPHPDELIIVSFIEPWVPGCRHLAGQLDVHVSALNSVLGWQGGVRPGMAPRLSRASMVETDAAGVRRQCNVAQ
jgi:plasmid maintenance system antidote protein VapI